MAFEKTFGTNFRNDDLRRLRGVLGFYSPKGMSIPVSQLIRKLVNDKYDELRKQKKIVDYLKMD